MLKSILIIDDSAPLHNLINIYLKPEGLTIHSTYDGEAGLTAALVLLPGLILLDIDMPVMDGYEVCRRLKARPETADIPVIFLTASSTLDEKLKGMDLGALDYLCKPFKPLEFRARVRAVLHTKNRSIAVNLTHAAL